MSIKCLFGMHVWNDFTTCAKCAKTRSVSHAVPDLRLANTLSLITAHGLRFMSTDRPALLVYGSFGELAEDKRRGMVEVLGSQMGAKWTDMVKGDEGDYARLAASNDPEALSILVLTLLHTKNMQRVEHIAIALSKHGGDKLIDVLRVVSPGLRDEKTREEFARTLSGCGIDLILDVLRIVPRVIRDEESRTRLERCFDQGAAVNIDGTSDNYGEQRSCAKTKGKNMTWDEVKQKYGQYISGDPVDDQTFPRARLHTFYRDHAHANAVLGRIAGDAAAILRPTSEGMSQESGASKYHVVHEGNLTGKQIKEYLITVVDRGGEVWEVLL